MSEKSNRHQVITRLVSRSEVLSQEELLALLSQEGITTTQATLSRDLKELKISKSRSTAKGYCYEFTKEDPRIEELKSGHPFAGILSTEFSDRFLVVKTRPGYASMVASVIDGRLGKNIMGTIAGDDTILIIMRSASDTSKTKRALIGIIPEDLL